MERSYKHNKHRNVIYEGNVPHLTEMTAKILSKQSLLPVPLSKVTLMIRRVDDLGGRSKGNGEGEWGEGHEEGNGEGDGEGGKNFSNFDQSKR